jgi:hypothetical protein
MFVHTVVSNFVQRMSDGPDGFGVVHDAGHLGAERADLHVRIGGLVVILIMQGRGSWGSML